MFYRLYIDNHSLIKDNFLSQTLFMLSGVIAGWTNENTAAAMIVIIILYFSYYKFNKLKIPKWSISCFIGSIIGYVIMIIAPGNFIKANNAAPDNTLFILKVIIRIFQYTYYMFWNMPILILLLAILLYSTIYINKTLKNSFKSITIPIIYCIGIFIAAYSMILAAYFPNRAWFGAVCFAIISIGNLWLELSISINLVTKLKTVIIIICIPILLSSYIHAYRTVNLTNFQHIERDKFIKEERKTGNLDITVDKIYPLSQYCALYNLKDLSSDPNDLYNIYLFKYYNVNSIKSK